MMLVIFSWAVFSSADLQESLARVLQEVLQDVYCSNGQSKAERLCECNGERSTRGSRVLLV